ncbi:YdjY domain-containing protein [Opitutales bacterium]|nr:YdjY domain-containing protein [Opitutales bacterium]
MIIDSRYLLKIITLFFFNSYGLFGTEENASKLPEIIKVKEGVYQFGSVVINRKMNSLSIPAVSNQVNGLVEYGIVHENGKIHESLFRTKVRPQIFHTSLLLLKAKPVSTFFDNLWSDDPKLIDYSKNCFEISVFWEINGTKFENKIEKLSVNQIRKGNVEKKSFIFTGSRMVEGTFLAESSGSILAIYADDTAILNNSDYDSTNDDVWIANEREMPPLELPVTIRFNLPMVLD